MIKKIWTLPNYDLLTVLSLSPLISAISGVWFDHECFLNDMTTFEKEKNKKIIAWKLYLLKNQTIITAFF